MQINSKMRAKITLSKSLSKEEIEKAALANEDIIAALSGAAVKKVIVIPNRLINIIV